MSKTKQSSERRRSIKFNNFEGHGSRTLENFTGLGMRYFNQMGNHIDKIHQIDTISGVTETYGSVRGRSAQLAAAMDKLGVAPNDVVVICSKNHADQTIAVLATLFIGAIVAPLDPEINSSDCHFLLSKLKPKICFCDVRPLSQIERVLFKLKMQTQFVIFGEELEDKIKFSKLFKFKEEETFRPVETSESNMKIAFILPTQGTSGHPKLVCLSHNNILLQSLILLEILGFPQKIISFFPLCWILQTLVVCASFETQITRVMSGPFQERSACKMIHDLGIDYALLGTPYALKFVSHPAVKDYNINCMKCIVVGGNKTSKTDLDHFRYTLPKVHFLQIYVTTETGCVAAMPFGYYCKEHNCVGKVYPNCKLKVVDPDTGESLGQDVFGELYYNGEGLMMGYYKEPKLTLSSMERGYFKTGDIIKYDEQGCLYFHGRKEDLIDLDGVKFSPIWLEEAIVSHPLIEDSVVVGKGSEIVACVIAKPESNLTSEKLMAYIEEKLPYPEKPTKIVFFKEFPLTLIGKVKTNLIRKEMFEVEISYSRSLASITL